MPLSTPALLARIAAEPWTSHNIRLNDEVTTRPGEPDFMATDLRLQAILRVLHMLFGDRLAGLRAADLGCLEGGFSLALAQRGVETVGIEARQLNLVKTLLLREHFDLPNMAFELGDVKDFKRESKGVFDIVLALGILYHLDRPVEWLKQIAETTKRVLILETHYAPVSDQDCLQMDRDLPLGPLVTMEANGNTYQGRWFQEYSKNENPEPMRWASYSNENSFWLTRESLFLSVLRAGFPLLFEQHDYSAWFYQRATVNRCRTMLVAVKPAAT